MCVCVCVCVRVCVRACVHTCECSVGKIFLASSVPLCTHRYF